MVSKKKKKAPANPARGFATTSIASKPKVDRTSDTGSDPSTTISSKEPGKSTGQSAQTPSSNAQPEKELHQLTPEELQERLEREELQSFVDTNLPKVVRDSQRQITKVTTDCRVVRAQAVPISTSRWLPDELLTEIIDFARRERSHITSVPLPKDVSEDDWLVRFWSLSRTLIGIGIPKERVYQLLNKIQLRDYEDDANSYVWGLHESLDQLSLDPGGIDLPSYSLSKVSNLNVPDADDSDTSRPPTGTATPNQTLQKRPPTVPIDPQDVQIVAEMVDDVDVSDVDSSAEPDQLEFSYIATKMKLFSIHPDLAADDTAKRRKQKGSGTITPSSPGIKKLQDKLRRIETDMLFDKDAAQMKWGSERIRLLRESTVLKSRRRRDESSASSGDEHSRPNTANASSTPADKSDVSDHEEMLGDMFTAPGEEVGDSIPGDESDAKITLRDFGKLSGVSPRRILEDSCRARYVSSFDILPHR